MQHNPAKVGLSKYELELVTNAQILLTKNDIIQKVYELFGALSDHYKQCSQSILPNEILMIPPKISRGENYEGLPYVMLDYPRYFKKDNTLAIRTFFWWGNFFSITLQLAGDAQKRYLSNLNKANKNGLLDEWFYNVGASEWQHHFRQSNYQLIKSETNFLKRDVIKIAKKIPLEKWDDVQDILQTNFTILMNILRD